MKKAVPIFIIAICAIMMLVSSFNIKTIEASNGAEYNIERVTHRIEVTYNGYIFINNTVQISGQAPDGFLIGFPHKYGTYVLECIAYNSSHRFPVRLAMPLEGRAGFYAVRVDFPEDTPQVFNVVFILSKDLLIQSASTPSQFTLDFPAYPSLTKDVAVSNVSIVVQGAQYLSGTIDSFVYGTENLPAFTYSPANVTFSISDSQLQPLEIKELKREIKINELGEIEGSDAYYIINMGIRGITFVEIILPPNAFSPIARDQFGRLLPGSAWLDETTRRYKVSFASSLDSGRATRFTVVYNLPSQAYIKVQDGLNIFNLSSLFQKTNYYIEQKSVSFVLPEGARIHSSGDHSVVRNVFQEVLTINRAGISAVGNFLPSDSILQFEYEYNLLWSAFRPTLWIWSLAIVGCAVLALWKRPKAPISVAIPVATARFSPEHVKSFIDAYEERRKLIRDMESLESKVRKGKIPRRRYKVQKKTIETRLNALSRNLAELKEKMRVAGGQYVELMRQLEIAETEINEVEANIRSIEARHSRGELSLEAYRKLLADYQRRKEKAKTVIDGTILRFREQIH